LNTLIEKFKRRKYLAIYIFATFTLTIIGQNCSTIKQKGANIQDMSVQSYSDEDDIWTRLASARIKVNQLKALTDYETDTKKIVDKSPKKLADQLQVVIDSLENMLLVQLIPSNSQEVIKKYTSLVDLLSEARDVLIIYYSKLDMEAFQNSLNSLDTNFTNLSTSLNALDSRFVAYQEQVKADFDVVSGSLISTNVRIDALSERMSKAEGNITTASLDINLIKSHTIPELERMAASTASSFLDFTLKTSQLANAGAEAYQQTLNQWNCLDAQKYDLGNGTKIAGEACVRSNEEALYKICRAAFPTFCVSCTNSEMADCPSWSDSASTDYLTPRQRLGILIDIQQQISIENLKIQLQAHNERIFGSPNCKDGRNGTENCLVFPENGTITYPLSCSDNNELAEDQWKKCGLGGEIYSLHMADTKLADNIKVLSGSLTDSVLLINNTIEAEKLLVRDRFNVLNDDINNRLNKFKADFDTGLRQIASAITTGSFEVSPTIANDLATALASSTANAISENEKLEAVITRIHTNIYKQDQTTRDRTKNEISDVLKNITRDLAQGSITPNGATSGLINIANYIIRDTLYSLDANQFEGHRPQYDLDLKTRIESLGAICAVPGYTPFTNVFGRDPMHLLGVALMRKVVMGNGPATLAGSTVSTIFTPYQQPLVTNSLTSTIFLGSMLDYREDISISANQACLDAVEEWANNVFASNTSGKITTNAAGVTENKGALTLLTNPTIVSDLASFAIQFRLLSDNLTKLQEIITLTAAAPTDTTSAEYLEYKTNIQAVILDLVQAAKFKYDGHLAEAEYNRLLQIQGAFSKVPDYIQNVAVTLNNMKAKQAEFIITTGSLHDRANNFDTALINANLTMGSYVDDRVSSATSALQTSVSNQISTATSALQASVSSQISTATLALNNTLDSRISTATSALNSIIETRISTATSSLSTALNANLTTATSALNTALNKVSALALDSAMFSMSSDLVQRETILADLKQEIQNNFVLTTQESAVLASATATGVLIANDTNFDPIINSMKYLFRDGAIRDSSNWTGASNTATTSADCNENTLLNTSAPTVGFFSTGFVCGVSLRFVNTTARNNVWFKLWGAMRKLKVSATGFSEITFDFSDTTATNSTIENGTKIKSIGTNQVKFIPPTYFNGGTYSAGMFVFNINNLFESQVNQYTTNLTFTPIKVLNGADVLGSPKTYAMLLYSPLVLNFNPTAGGIDTISSFRGVDFDLKGKGSKQTVGWVRPEQGGFLVLDLNNNNMIDSGKEMFGEATNILGTNLQASNGYIALSQYDNNGDGSIDHKDKIFKSLKVWFDLNTDGISQPGEITSLQSLEINKLKFNYIDVEKEQQLNNGNRVRYQAKFYGPKQCGADGCNSYDIYFMSGHMEELAATSK
jgi:hypothetical protein